MTMANLLSYSLLQFTVSTSVKMLSGVPHTAESYSAVSFTSPSQNKSVFLLRLSSGIDNAVSISNRNISFSKSCAKALFRVEIRDSGGDV